MNKKGIKIEEIINLHNLGFPPIKIAEKLNCDLTNISKRLLKSGIKPIRTVKYWGRKNRYSVNESYFNIIDTEEKAYILGLMYADGSVSEGNFYIKMKDEDVLIKIKKALNAEQLIRLYKRGNYEAYILNICSQKLAKSLVQHGCFINKTYTLSFPNIPIFLYPHFIRGFYDGDGCLQINNNSSQCRFDLTSASTKLLKDIQNIISPLVSTKGSLIKESGISNAWHLKYSGFRINMILDWLYKDSSIFMKRKHDKFLIYKSVHVKQGELLEKPEEVNQQPSLGSNAFEGSTTNSQVQTSNVEDSNADTSALPDILTYASMMKIQRRWAKNSVMI